MRIVVHNLENVLYFLLISFFCLIIYLYIVIFKFVIYHRHSLSLLVCLSLCTALLEHGFQYNINLYFSLYNFSKRKKMVISASLIPCYRFFFKFFFFSYFTFPLNNFFPLVNCHERK